MATGRTALPQPVTDAIEECIKASQKFGYAASRGNEGVEHHWNMKMRQAKDVLVIAIEAHASAMYEAGIDVGRAQGDPG